MIKFCQVLFLCLIIFQYFTTKIYSQKLGVNYNRVFSQINDTDLKRCDAKLIRGFVDYFDFKSGKKNLYTDTGLKKLKENHSQGFKVILNIKFNSYQKFQMATYGLYQNEPQEFTAKTNPWIINPLFVNVTVEKDSLAGEYQTNYKFFEEFVKLVR